MIAYLALAAGNADQLALAMYLFGVAGIGIKFPNTAMDQFNAGNVWDVTKNAKIEGGHYIPGVGRDAKGNIVIVTWGKIQLMTPRFYTKYLRRGRSLRFPGSVDDKWQDAGGL